MTSAEIQGKINYYSSCISSYDQQITELRSKIDQADEFYSGLVAYTNKAGEVNEARKTKLSGAASLSFSNRILERYYDGMNAKLTGSEFTNAYSNLTNSCERVSQKINELNSDLSDLIGQRNAAQSSRDYWYGQMRYADDNNRT